MEQMVTVKKEKTIDFPVEEVWQFIEPADHIAKWFPGAEYSEKISGQGIGRKQLMFVKSGKKETEFVQEIIDYRAGNLIKWKFLREVLNGKEVPLKLKEAYLTIQLDQVGSKTRITVLSENLPRTGWRAMLFKLRERQKIERTLEKALINIEDRIRHPQFPRESLMDALL
jgi:uncharacterized protein YndB with AHSA1/START domain